jgi:beta-glucosidase
LPLRKKIYIMIARYMRHIKKAVVTILFYFSGLLLYSQVYPFQNIKLSDEKRLDNLISLLTLDEKINCLSTRPAIARLGIKGTRIVEGLHGLALSGPANWAVKGKGQSFTTTFPQAIGLAQTWDPLLINQVASMEADECRYLAQNPKYASAGLIVLAPNADLGRDVRWGRTEECYGEDPHLTASMTMSFVKGLQGNHPRYWKTASMLKHFLANSNENNRYTNSSNADEQLFREYYSYPFFKGITVSSSRAFMAAYNKYNDTPCAVHPMLKKITVKEWNQNGIIATDGGAFQKLVNDHHFYPDLPTAAAACIKAGITMFLDDYKTHLKKAVETGLVTEKEIDEAIRGSLRVLLKLGLLDQSDSNPYSKIGITDSVDLWTKDNTHAFVRKVTSASVVLLQNKNDLLPIVNEKIKRIAVIGPSANLVVSDWYAGTPPYAVSALQGIKKAVGDKIEIRYAASNKADSAVIAARESDIAIVCVGNHPLSYGMGWGQNLVASDGREEVDRQALSLEQEDLVKLVYAANPNTVLVLISSFPYTINWSKKNIPSILHITQSSQELGNGLADILFGKVNPAGRLAQTWPESIEELPPILDYNIRNGRTYMYSKNKPLFPFGHGLSYTQFAYSSREENQKTLSATDSLIVDLTITNTGSYDGEEVVQLYISFPECKVSRPAKALKVFKKVFVPKGKTVKTTLALPVSECSYWNSLQHKFVCEPGRVRYLIGRSSENIYLSGEFTIR